MYEQAIQFWYICVARWLSLGAVRAISGMSPLVAVHVSGPIPHFTLT